MKKKILLILSLILFCTNFTESKSLRTEQKYDGLYNEKQFSSNTSYLSYVGLIRFGMFEACHCWVKRSDVEHYLDIQMKLKKMEGW